jgi:hypothetical protein
MWLARGLPLASSQHFSEPVLIGASSATYHFRRSQGVEPLAVEENE